MEIIPAIIPEDFEDLEEKLQMVKGLVPLVQIDIIDGNFAPDSSWPYAEFSGAEEFQKMIAGERGLPFWKECEFEVDLMIEDPEKNIETWVQAGFSRVIVHFESTDRLDEILEKLQGRVEIGLAVNIDTAESELEPYLEKVDFVQCMGIAHIGLQGEKLDERVIPKIQYFKSRFPGVIISVDGGVDLVNAKALKDAGADRLVSGSAIYEAPDMKEALYALQNPE